ncbi:MAG: hypothetical protein IPM07_30890 [Anaerolineales bacterium]|nr:hypothetical protein [Anaerolineales bacterium]
MTTYTNAAASHSALFDNAPTVTAATVANAQPSVTTAAVPQTLTVHTTPATRISQGRNGQWYRHDVLMQYGRPVPLDLAIKRVAIGRTVFVAREDAGAVMETLLRNNSTG